MGPVFPSLSFLPSQQGGGEGDVCPMIWSQTASLLSELLCPALWASAGPPVKGGPLQLGRGPAPSSSRRRRLPWSLLEMSNQIPARAASSESANPFLRFHVQPQRAASLIRVAPAAPAAGALSTGQASTVSIPFSAHKTMALGVHRCSSTEKRARSRWSGGFPDVSCVAGAAEAGPVLWVTTLSLLLPSRALSRFA